MTAILSAIIPVGFIILVGYIGDKFLSLERKSLSVLSVYILAPAIIVYSFYSTKISIESATGLLLGFIVTTILLLLAVFFLTKILHLSTLHKTSLIATTLLPNNGNMGLPVVTFGLGEAGLDRAIIYMVFSSILLFGFAPALLSGKGFRGGLDLTFKLPLVWAIFVGLALKFLQIPLPFNLDEGIKELGFASIPVALIILGIQLSQSPIKIGKDEFLAASLRLILAPFIAFVVGNVLGLKGLDLQVLVLQSAMPTAINTLVLVTQFGGDASRVARSIVFSTLMSFVTIPIVLWVIT